MIDLELLNNPSFTAILMKFIFMAFGIYLICLQFIETLRPQDSLTRLRWQILFTLVLSVVSQVPSVYYQFARLLGDSSDIIRDVVTITSNVSLIAIMILLILIFKFKRKE